MKLKLLDKRQMAELAGRMVIEEKILTANQMSELKKEIYQSEHFTGNTLWDFYNHGLQALKKATPPRLSRTTSGYMIFWWGWYSGLDRQRQSFFLLIDRKKGFFMRKLLFFSVPKKKRSKKKSAFNMYVF
jgi:hypothetical protein